MRWTRRARLAVVLVAGAGLLGLSACTNPKKTPPYVCESGAATTPPTDEAAATSSEPLTVEEAGEEAKVAVAEAEVLTPEGDVPLVTVEQTPAGPEIVSTPVADAAEAEAVAEAAAADGDLVTVEPDSLVSAEGMPFPNDAFYPQQYVFDQIPFVETWTAYGGGINGPGAGAGQVVAVLDTGVQASHPELDDGRVMPGLSYRPPEEGTAQQDLSYNGHGTAVAGIITAETDNGAGVAGAAPAADIMPIKVLNPNGQGLTSQVAQAVVFAADYPPVTVINLSLGGPNPSDVLHGAIRHAVNTKGKPVIAASGNSGKCGNPSYPAAFAEVLAVGAINSGYQWASFSTTGPYVDVVTAGQGVKTLSTGAPPYTEKSGTSFAAPYAAAAAAIVHARYPAFNAGQVYGRLTGTATDLGAPGWDPHFGSGVINVILAAG
ncbi:MAG TPA: S8 family serine peptidase [Acidimicrobiia bacterium]